MIQMALVLGRRVGTAMLQVRLAVRTFLGIRAMRLRSPQNANADDRENILRRLQMPTGKEIKKLNQPYQSQGQIHYLPWLASRL
jgi:hypothetical protein